MWFESFFPSPVLQDFVAMIVTFAVSLIWLRLMDGLAQRGLLEPRLSRKVIHIGTGPLFVLCWTFYSSSPAAKYWAGVVPLAITLQFVAVGLGWMKDEAAVQAMTRHGDRREILLGPVFYGLVFVACTIGFWRTSPVGILSLMILCGGDGLAEIVGGRWGKTKLPHNADKSWWGSAAMWAGGVGLSFVILWLFNSWGILQPALDEPTMFWKVSGVALGAAAVESLPLADLDNLTITATAIVLGGYFF
jgi:phytol kinase